MLSEAAKPLPKIVRFGPFEADLRSGELRKRGLKLRLEGQPMQVLMLLLQRPGELVTREELKKELWPSDTFVDFDVSINALVKRLRQALDDSADTPRFIETLPRRGYRFIYPLNGGAVETIPPPLLSRRRWIAVLSLLGVACVAGILIGLHVAGVHSRWSGSAEAPAIKSLAVLPLENLTGDADQEYLVDGIHDELITELAQISALKVISRTSVLRYKQQKKPLREIAGELNVDGVLEGTMRREGDRWHVTAQLISARDDRHLWAQSYIRSPREVPTIPSEIARAVAQRLHLRLTPEQEARLTQAHPLDPALYQAYFKGKYHLDKWTNESLQKAVGYFREALDVDPTYAPAWAAIGEAYEFLGGHGRREGEADGSKGELRRRAEAALLRAVELDPTLREPHQALGRIKFAQWDWEGGAREFERAHELDPSHPGFPVYLLISGRFDEAVKAQRREAERNPLDYSSQLVAGYTAFMAGHYDEAIVALKRTVDLDPSIHHAHYELAWSYAKKGMYEKAVLECETALQLLRQKQPKTVAVASCGWVYAVAGKRREALEIAHQVQQDSNGGEDRSIALAHLYDALGDRARALAYLSKAFETKGGTLPRQWFVPMLSDDIKADPRFQELIRRTGIPWARFPAQRTANTSPRTAAPC